MKRKKVWISGGGLVLLVLIIGSVVALRGENGEYDSLTVTTRDVVEEVEVSGTVEAGIVADLGLEVTGRARNVLVQEGASVRSGQTLVTLDLGTLPAELQSAQADVAIKRAEVENTSINIEAIQEQQATLVASSYRKLLSESLVAEPSSATYTQTPPTITGRYTGDEGEYTIRIVQSEVNTNEYQLYTFGIESTGAVEINRTGATPIGTEGLFVSFPDPLADYADTRWHITIPNTESASYTANYNAYQEALRERERAIEAARAQLRTEQTGTSVAEAELARAEAEIARINAQIAQRTLTAPFAGTVTQVLVDPGEIVAANTTAISLISANDFGVEVDLPEIDSLKVRVGDPATIELDALSGTADGLLSATVVSVNRTETIVDGVPVYEARLAFDEPNESIQSGMTATVIITTEKREDVLAVPVRAVRFREDSSTYVLVREGESSRETDVAVGLRGSDAYIEILSGVSLGDTLLIPRN